ncbi:MAG: cytochrome c oxidase subunit II [Polyangiales bacterium]
MFDPVSPQASAISDLFILVLWICAAILVVVVSIIAYAIIRAIRERRRGQEAPDAVENDHAWLEAIWTAIPLAIVAAIFVLSVGAARDSDPVPEGPPDVVVRGHQWWWEVEYPGSGVVSANEVHVPVGTKVHLQLESGDVIHDFWVPALSRKIDVVPGRVHHLVFTPEEPGLYEGVCAEFCGVQHAWMRFDVVVHPVEEFEAWLEAQSKPAEPPSTAQARAGLAVYTGETCNACHALSGLPDKSRPMQVGPDLTHLASRRLIGSGVLPNSEANLAKWMKNPQAIKEGCHMPNFQFSTEDTAALAAFLHGLK